MEHIVVHKDTAYHSAFPHVIRLRNGDLVCIFRQSRFREGYADGEARDRSLAHYHLDPDSRIALVRSTDDGRTWNPDSFTVIDADQRRTRGTLFTEPTPGSTILADKHAWASARDALGELAIVAGFTVVVWDLVFKIYDRVSGS